ncbi:MAG: GFA family protein [Bradyrhizobium sp.]
MTRTASCQCGQLSLTVEGEPALVSACNCTRCQKRSGSAFALSSRWNTNQVRDRSGNGLTYNRKGTSGGNVQFVFCAVCGSTVSTSLEFLPEMIGIPVGCFADPTFPAPKVAAWCESKLEWVRFPDELLLLRDQTQAMEPQQV